MVEAFLLTCLQANFLIGRIRTHTVLNPEQKVLLEKEVRLVTRKDCPIY